MTKPGSPQSREVTFLVPGLFALAGSAPVRPAVPLLAALIARADPAPPLAAGFEARLFGAFGLGGDRLPVAAVTRLADTGERAPGWWLRADPVHLRVDGDRLLLMDSETLRISQQEARDLTAELRAAFTDWRLEAPRPDRWYLGFDTARDVRTHPLPAVAGRNIHAYLPEGPEARPWRTMLNEVQMLLHAAPVNAAREARGEPPVNSLWFWGEGELPPAPAGHWAQVWAHEPVSEGLARLAGVPFAELPAAGTDWLSQALTPGAHLVVLHRARGAAQYGDVQGWLEFVEGFEAAWLVPLMRALKTGALDAVTVYAETGPGYRLTRRALRRWWRRPRDIRAV